MLSFISILRGINVSGHNMIKMEALKTLFQNLGFNDVRTYIQSGNVIFQAGENDTEEMAAKIRQKIKETFGFEVPVLVLEQSLMQNIYLNNPFLKSRITAEGSLSPLPHLHVTFLAKQLLPENMGKLQGLQFAPDEFVIMDKVVYLFCPNGYGRTKLTNSFFESKLKVTATTRNWKTVEAFLKVNEN